MTDAQLEIPEQAGFTVQVGGDGVAKVATITLSRPDKLNSMNPDTWHWLNETSRWLGGDVRVVVVRGQGRAFSAGLDRSMFTPEGVNTPGGLIDIARSGSERGTEIIASYQASFGWLARPDIVSVALVQGHVIGGGFQLSLACDLRIVVDDAQFAMAEPTLGVVPDLGGTKRLVDLVGYSRAASICLTGRRVGAAEADRIGLASQVVSAEDADATLAATVLALLAVNRDASIETKALLLGAGDRSQGEQEVAEREAQFRRLTDLGRLLGVLGE